MEGKLMAIVEELIVSDYGAFVGVKGGRLYIEIPDKPRSEAPLMHLRNLLVLTRSASISAATYFACADAGVMVNLIDPVDGDCLSMLSNKMTTVVQTRRSQLEAVNSLYGVAIAKRMAIGKITSQAQNLRYIARRQEGEIGTHLKETATELLGYADQVAKLEAQSLDEIRNQMMGYEGYGARLYWQALAPLIPAEYDWHGRTGRGAKDPVNVLLNYGYGILYGEVQQALYRAGLEPYAGLIHTDRPGKPSLTCDLIEEFRAPIVDRAVIGLINRHYTVSFDDNGLLTRDMRRNFAEHILNRLRAQGVYDQKRYELRSIIQKQARKLATAFRAEADYTPYGGG
jgi:CRISPR-associated protein Cas1